MSKSELSYTIASLSADPSLREDGRGLTDYRPIHIATGVYAQASGSARVECGGCEVAVGVMCEVSGLDDTESGENDSPVKCTVTW